MCNNEKTAITRIAFAAFSSSLLIQSFDTLYVNGNSFEPEPNKEDDG